MDPRSPRADLIDDDMFRIFTFGGPDSVELLNRLYTNACDSLAIGMYRYGVMCAAPTGWVSTTASSCASAVNSTTKALTGNYAALPRRAIEG